MRAVTNSLKIKNVRDKYDFAVYQSVSSLIYAMLLNAQNYKRSVYLIC